MNTPKWAQDLVQDAILYLQGKGFNSNPPDIKWRHALRKDSSGVCHLDSVSIVAGKNRTDCKLVILHELAHWVLPLKYGHEGHTSRFWDVAWDLFREFKLPIRYCKEREVVYRKGALVAYHRNRKAIKHLDSEAHQSPDNHMSK